MNVLALALGIGTRDSSGNWLEIYYPTPLLQPDPALAAVLLGACGYTSGKGSVDLDASILKNLYGELSAYPDMLPQISAMEQSIRPVVLTVIESDQAPSLVPEVYLKLHLISHRLCKPHSLNLEGMFGVLQNVAWTSEGAISVADLPARQLAARLHGKTIEVNSVDKFPKMSDYVVPTGVRIANAAQVRLGAYLGEGTTIMHAGFVNFNAGTEGKAMIEGRIAAGVIVGEGSDLGGGASIIGTLSGGGKIVNSVGKDSLVGANAGIGFPLGDRCIIEAGLYVTAGTKVTLLDNENNVVKVVKARELAGKNDLLFRRNSTTGTVECKTNQTKVELNADLHAHN